MDSDNQDRPLIVKLGYLSPGELYRQVAKDVSLIQSASRSVLQVIDGELEMHPGYPVIIADPVRLAESGDSIDKDAYKLFEFFMFMAAQGGHKVQNPYTDAIGKSLPKKGIMLLNCQDQDKWCVIHSPDLGGFSVAGIRYGGCETQQDNGGAQYGNLQAVPVSALPFPIRNYGIARPDVLHPLGTIVGGANLRDWNGKYFAAHFVMGLFLQDLYHGENTDMVSIGNPYFDTSKGHLPHTHYSRVSKEPLLLEERLAVMQAKQG